MVIELSGIKSFFKDNEGSALHLYIFVELLLNTGSFFNLLQMN